MGQMDDGGIICHLCQSAFQIRSALKLVQAKPKGNKALCARKPEGQTIFREALRAVGKDRQAGILKGFLDGGRAFFQALGLPVFPPIVIAEDAMRAERSTSRWLPHGLSLHWAPSPAWAADRKHSHPA